VVDPVKERHIKDLEGLVNKHKVHMRSVETEVQQLAKRPAVDEGSVLQVLREELVNESRHFEKRDEVHRPVVFSLRDR
jgi:hypothetical protein